MVSARSGFLQRAFGMRTKVVCWGFGLASLVGVSVARAEEADEAQQASETEPASPAAQAGWARGREAVQISLQGSLVDYQKFTAKADSGGSSSDSSATDVRARRWGSVWALATPGISCCWAAARSSPMRRFLTGRARPGGDDGYAAAAHRIPAHSGLVLSLRGRRARGFACVQLAVGWHPLRSATRRRPSCLAVDWVRTVF